MTSIMDLKQSNDKSNPQASEPPGEGIPATTTEEEIGMQQVYTPKIEPLQIQVSSTFDADMILRKIIEDRSAILALRSEADRNEKELLKAKVWQMQTSEQLMNAERDISRHAAKAKYEIAEYNESSKQYIHGFVAAFQNGDIDKLRHHPFVPSLKDLEDAVARRKALVIEKVQADDRVRKLEIISSRHHIAKTVLKKNEEAFVRAIAIAKQQFSDSCGSWLQQFEVLLSDISDQGIAGKKDKVSVHVSHDGANGMTASPKAAHHHVKRPKNSLKRPPEDQGDAKCKQYKSESGPVVADLRHDEFGINSNSDPSPMAGSLGMASLVNSTPPPGFSQANSELLNDMAIAEALTRLGG